jgi:hypothetical protein
MAVKTLNTIESIASQGGTSRATTYSIECHATSLPADAATESRAELESFLQAENPLGCFRGVMWVMAFNAAAFLLGFMIWQGCKFLL